MKLLILGGTHEAKTLALKLAKENFPIIYSLSYSKPLIAFIAETQNLEIYRGGFSTLSEDCSENHQKSLDGLLKFIALHRVGAILDMTHEYAYKISGTAQEACFQHKIPYWKFSRPAWEPTDKDHWVQVSSKKELFAALDEYQRPFFTIGSSAIGWVSNKNKRQHWIIRCLQRDSPLKLQGVTLLESPPLQSVEQEIHVIKTYNVDCIVSKNSGSQKAIAKIKAARILRLPVIILKRSETNDKMLFSINKQFTTLESCYLHCHQWLKNRGISLS